MRPFVSLCVMFHNQVDYVEQVLAGAFSQTYANLEIVISDDASTDGTSEKVRECIERYRLNGGKCQVSYDRNPVALGMLGNREHVYGMAHGELLINADGDDIPLPNRVEELVKAWVEDGGKATIICCEAVIIDEKNRVLGVTHKNGSPMGALLALKASILSYFPPVCKDAAYHAHDDLVYDLRARMFGERLYVNKHLVLYRYGTGESSGGQYRKRMVRGFTGVISGMRQALIDLKGVRDVISADKYSALERYMEKEIIRHQTVLPLWISNSFRRRIAALFASKELYIGMGNFMLSMILLLPLRIGDYVFALVGKLTSARKRMLAKKFVDVADLSKYVQVGTGGRVCVNFYPLDA